MEGFDIFNLPTDAFITPEKKSTTEFYSPSADKGRDGVYKALIRFLPNVHNPALSKVMKYYVWLEDPATKEGFSVDCPSTVGKKSILKDVYWKLKKSESVRDQELAQESFGRVETYYSLVQILKDPNQPELEGKIMVFKYGSKINQKIEAQLKPEFGSPVNPFDLFEGRVFALQIVKKMKWNNYDQCEFMGDRTPLELDGKPIQKTKEDMQRVTDWLKAESTDISRYAYKEWDDDLTNRVLDVIRRIVPDGRMVEELAHSAKSEGYAGANAASASKSNAAAPSVSSFEQTAPERNTEPAPTKTKGVSSIDDLYNEL